MIKTILKMTNTYTINNLIVFLFYQNAPNKKKGKQRNIVFHESTLHISTSFCNNKNFKLKLIEYYESLTATL